MADTSVRVSSDAVAVFATVPTWSPTTPTGAGVTYDVVSVFALGPAPVAVTMDVVSVFVTDAGAGQTTDPGCPGSTPATHAFGYAT